MAFKSLVDLRRREEEAEGTSSFAGGERSGLAIQNPSEDFPHATAFESQFLFPDAATRRCDDYCRTEAPPSGARHVTVYSNGFLVEGGEFRPFGKPENDKFIQQLKEGVAPRELQDGGKAVHVVLEDRRGESYAPPPRAQYVLFGGEGQTLSGAQSDGRGEAPVAPVDVSRAAASEAPMTNPEDSAEIHFRFHDGQRATRLFLRTARVQEVFDYVALVAPVAAPGFRLLTGFPPKAIEEREATIAEAGLSSALIHQQRI